MSYDAIIIPPWSWASPAVELANKTWRKRILPIGDVSYQGRTLHFTEDYLSRLAEAFRDKAYDQVSFQLADAKNTHTNDPERHRGTIVDLQLESDGLYALAQVTDAGERILSENPQLGVSARIVENYSRSDGKYYPAAVQHILGTLDPRIPALGSWSPVEMSNDGQVVIDLSQHTWWGEPGPSFSLATSAVGARLGSGYYDDTDIDAVIQATLPQDYGYDTAGLADFTRTYDFANEIELTRQAEDAEPLAVRSEDRMANAIARIERGTYTPQGPRAYGFAVSNVTGMEIDGLVDEYGYSIERYPALGEAPATPDIVEALRPAMADLAQRPLLDASGNPWIDAKYGSLMTATDFIEAASGIRLGDADPYSPRPRRELVQAVRPQVWGDPDDPDNMPLPFPAETEATAAALAAQAGIATTASHQAQHAAAVREHQRQAARYRGPRHPDYAADLSNPVHEDTGLAAFGDAPWNGSLPVFTRGAA